MDSASLAASVLAMRQSVQVTELGMALLRNRMEAESRSVMQLLEGAARPASNPPHLGNQVDTTA